MRELAYWIVERSRGEFICVVDDCYHWSYHLSPKLFSFESDAIAVAKLYGGKSKRTVLIIRED